MAIVAQTDTNNRNYILNTSTIDTTGSKTSYTK